MEPTDWNAPREAYPDDFLAWFEGWYGPRERYGDSDEGDEYAVRRSFAFAGWNARKRTVGPSFDLVSKPLEAAKVLTKIELSPDLSRGTAVFEDGTVEPVIMRKAGPDLRAAVVPPAADHLMREWQSMLLEHARSIENRLRELMWTGVTLDSLQILEWRDAVEGAPCISAICLKDEPATVLGLFVLALPGAPDDTLVRAGAFARDAIRRGELQVVMQTDGPGPAKWTDAPGLLDRPNAICAACGEWVPLAPECAACRAPLTRKFPL